MRTAFRETLRLWLPLGAAWMLALAAHRLSWAWFPPSFDWPHLPSVSFAPWITETDYYSSTPQFLAPLFICAAAVMVIEIGKSWCVRSKDVGPGFYWCCVLFQCLLTIDIIATSAPDWTVHALSLLVTHGRQTMGEARLQSWPWPSLAALLLIAGGRLLYSRRSRPHIQTERPMSD